MFLFVFSIILERVSFCYKKVFKTYFYKDRLNCVIFLKVRVKIYIVIDLKTQFKKGRYFLSEKIFLRTIDYEHCHNRNYNGDTTGRIREG